MKTALIHEWLTTLTGSEEVLQCMYELYPSPLHVIVADKKKLINTVFENSKIETSFIQKLPFGVSKYRNFLPFFPFAVEQFDLSDYDLILSSSHAVAKGVITRNDQLHICYCHTPMRYAWDLYHPYLKDSNMERGLKSYLARIILHYIRIWDVTSAGRVDYYIANSEYIRKRIRKIYNRDAKVIYPPVNIEQFSLKTQKEDYYVAASRFVPYKKLHIIAEAFSSMPDKKLLIIGEGPDLNKIKSFSSKNIEIIHFPGKDKLSEYIKNAKAFVFAALEDFGIIPVEAQACGTPVIAYRKGGTEETVIHDRTGVHFNRQSPLEIIEAVKYFEKNMDKFNPETIRTHAEKFSRERFLREYDDFVRECIKEKI